MIASFIIALLGAFFVTYKAQANNKSKLNLTCLMIVFIPFLIIDGIALGIYIGNNHTMEIPTVPSTGSGTRHPDHAANNDMMLIAMLPELQDNNTISIGFIEESIWQDMDRVASNSSKYKEVWLFAYRETGGTPFANGTIVQSYLEIEDPDRVGMYFSFTCTATYMQTDSVS